MKIAIGILVAAGLVGLVYWYYTSSSSTTTTTGGTGSTTSGGILSSIKTAISNRANPGTTNPFSAKSLFTPSGIVEEHVARKDAVAPYVLQKFGVPGSVAQPIAHYASKLDISGYAENYIGSKAGSLFSKIGL